MKTISKTLFMFTQEPEASPLNQVKMYNIGEGSAVQSAVLHNNKYKVSK